MLLEKNKPKNLKLWVDEILAKTDLSKEVRKTLKELALSEIDDGGYRGDISSVWRKAGYGIEDIPDVYL